MVRLRNDVTSGELEPFWQVINVEPGVGMELAVMNSDMITLDSQRIEKLTGISC